VNHTAVKILNTHQTMAISTVRSDGWPQTTIVGFANRDFDIVFLIYRTGQKWANIQHDDRISIAVASEPLDLNSLQAVYAGAHAV
jgi:nitroimidazol reductase NimA-like FMN-containing flavoprotein (pyridoxamine 5'-phosphate oxidase superfamily)